MPSAPNEIVGERLQRLSAGFAVGRSVNSAKDRCVGTNPSTEGRLDRLFRMETQVLASSVTGEPLSDRINGRMTRHTSPSGRLVVHRG